MGIIEGKKEEQIGGAIIKKKTVLIDESFCRCPIVKRCRLVKQLVKR